MNTLRTILVLLGMLGPATAIAAGNCSVTSVTLSAVTYSNAAVTGTGAVGFICSRTTPSDGEITVNIGAGPGLYPLAGTRQAGNGANRIAYSLSTTAPWGDGISGMGNPQAAVTQFAKGNTDTYPGSFTFTFSMPASLNPVAGLSYSDTVVIGGTCSTSKASAGCTLAGSSLAIKIDVPVTCSISSPPGTLNLSYTSFQSTPGLGNVPFAATCSNGGPYRMSLTPASGTLLGVTYGLTLGTSAGSPTDISSSTSYNLRGTGSPATFYVNARAAAGQSGTCTGGTCSAISTPHTLRIEY